ncbi:hypothetical protein [Thiocystis violascens]|uniref:Uncharacterized protein n=1 Tax=Thiocystis violascens (strain ATCC 17096 / DSM 198 / 6111) TaxID=765911 RepID=I3YFE6_THIV6|nr:hypothetical protein [Thiocystis violascens]AFL75714.1 hypothetical protein Thivi_3874 [Thiocystis violascens DSM 198]
MPSIGKPFPDAPIPVSRDPRRPLFAVTALLLAALLPVVLWGLTVRLSEPRTGGAGDGREAAALVQWQALWSDLDARGEAALQPDARDSSLRAAGDTAFMRYRNLWGRVDKSARRAFQMAALSGDPRHKLALLQPLTTAADARTRFRAWLEMARVQLRLRDLEPAREAARAALVVADVPERIRSDAHFVLGAIAWESGSLETAESALTRAIAADPGFWDARQMRMRVLGRQLARPRQGVADCLDRTRQLILDLGALPALAQDRTQFRDIADRFAVQGAPANVAFALLAGLGYRWSGDPERARAALTSAEGQRGQLPTVCESLILEKAREWLGERP